MNNNSSCPQDEKSFSIRQLFQICGANWKWFLVSVVAFVGIGMLWIMRQQPVYNRSLQVLITDQENGGSSADLGNAFASMGLFSNKTSVYNELVAFRSPALMSEVVKRLDLTHNYLEKGFFHGTTLYAQTRPFIVDFIDVPPEKNASIEIELNPDNTFRIVEFVKFDENGKKLTSSDEVTGKIGDAVLRTFIGRLRILPNPAYAQKRDEETTVFVTQGGVDAVIESYCQKLDVDLADQDAEVINLSFDDVCIQRAVDVLNMIITVYNEIWVEDKNKMAISTSQFITDRLAVIEKELGDVDNDISNYKSEHLLTDLAEASSLYMNQAAKTGDEILMINNQLAMAKYVQQYLNDPATRYEVIPVNTGIGNVTLEQQIPSYNTLLMNRNTLARNSSADNPLVLDYDAQLRGLRSSIVNGVNAQVVSLTKSLRNMERSQGEQESHLASTPSQAKYLLSIERQQKVKESLYLYLLQKREENELNQTFTAYNTRIITPPYGSNRPVSPKKALIIIEMLVVGLMLPSIAFYYIESSNTKIRSRKDLEFLSIPLVGEIPFFGKKRKLKWFLSSKKKKQEMIDTPLAIVQEGNRDVSNEAFRVIRSNLEMMMGKDHGNEVIILTSFNPGSGKSFICYNLGAAFALKKRRVLLIDGDLRHGSLSMYVNSPRKGYTEYLNGNSDDWRQYVVRAENADIDVLPIGHRPPNPAELLEDGRLGKLVEEARGSYDIVMIDCPPTDIVVDTQIVAEYADRTLFVVRAGLFDKSSLVEVEELYGEHKYKKMSMILNGTENKGSRYHAYGSNYYSEM